MRKITVSKMIILIFLILIAFIFLLPFIWTFLTSIKDNKEIYAGRMIILPSHIYLGHYLKVLTGMNDFGLYFLNTVAVTFWSVLSTVFLSATTGYAFGKLDFAGKSVFLVFVLLVLALPYAIYLIPIYIMENWFNLINTQMGLTLPYIAINLPISIFIMRGVFKNIPDELGESAIIDGCNAWQLWAKVMMPIARPGLAIVLIFTFINVWGEFMFARTLTSTPEAQTLAVGITFLRDEAASWQYGTLCTVITLSLIPLLAVFLAFQKYFLEKGIMAGALKG